MPSQQSLSLYVFVTLLYCSPINAKQAISESLVDCAAIFTISTRAFPERETAKTLALKYAEKTLVGAARERAVSEGRSQPDTYVNGLITEKQEKWDAKGAQFIFTEEFRDWTSYCRALSKRLDIQLKPN